MTTLLPGRCQGPGRGGCRPGPPGRPPRCARPAPLTSCSTRFPALAPRARSRYRGRRGLDPCATAPRRGTNALARARDREPGRRPHRRRRRWQCSGRTPERHLRRHQARGSQAAAADWQPAETLNGTSSCWPGGSPGRRSHPHPRRPGRVVDMKFFSDHHRYSRREVELLARPTHQRPGRRDREGHRQAAVTRRRLAWLEWRRCRSQELRGCSGRFWGPRGRIAAVSTEPASTTWSTSFPLAVSCSTATWCWIGSCSAPPSGSHARRP
jgi:hypothetical protein